VSCEALGSGLGGEGHGDRGQHGAPGMIEIVEVMIVAQQHRIERTDFVHAEGRAGGLF
jgi:hypothetical protein